MRGQGKMKGKFEYRRSKSNRKSEACRQNRNRKGRAVSMSLILLFTTLISITVFSPVSSAQLQTTSHYGWAGYKGNQSIYLTTFLTNTNQMYFPSVTYGSLETQPSIGGFYSYQGNAVSIGIGGHANTTNGNTMPFEEYYVGSPNNVMVINIPVTASGASNWTSGINPEGATYYSSIDYEKLSLNIPSIYPTAIVGLQTSYDNGINVSSTYNIGTDSSQVGWNTMWYLLGLLPEVGTVVGTYQYVLSLYNPAGLSNPAYQQVGPGNYTAGSFGMDNRMTRTWADSFNSYGYDTYGVTTVYQLTIKSSDFNNAGKLTIGADNIEQINEPFSVATSNGAYSSVQVNVAPAYAISGTAYDNGSPIANQYIEFYDTNGTAYYVMTDSNGNYRFFADPGHDYTTEYPLGNFPNPSSITIDVPASNTSGQTSTLNFNAIVGFTSTIKGYVHQQSGYPASVQVTVSYNGNSESTNTNSNGFYQLYVNQPEDYELEIKSIYNNFYYSVNVVSSNSVYWQNATVASYSGGGCVLYGTNITLADGYRMPVQNLSAGMKVLSFNTNNGKFYSTHIVDIEISRVSTIVNIDGLIGLSGLNDQPVYVELGNGTREWLVLGAINTTMSIYDPLNGTWVHVFSYDLVPGNFTVYEVITKNGFYINDHTQKVFDYIANGFLVDRKIG